jgi:hypothetical protein
MTEDSPDLRERLARLSEDFVIVGGYAGFVCAFTQVTRDTGTCCDFARPNLPALPNAIPRLPRSDRVPPGRPAPERTPEYAHEARTRIFGRAGVAQAPGPGGIWLYETGRAR